MLFGPITQSGSMDMETVNCQHPKHKECLEAFLKKYPTVNKDAHFAINMVNPEEWYVFEDSAKNTVRCLHNVHYYRRHTKVKNTERIYS